MFDMSKTLPPQKSLNEADSSFSMMKTLAFTAVNLPLEGIGLIWAIDWFLDRCRTTVNSCQTHGDSRKATPAEARMALFLTMRERCLSVHFHYWHGAGGVKEMNR